jgi:putative hydrolase of HD superfamily
MKKHFFKLTGNKSETGVITLITRSLIERIFSAANIERWNDHPRPVQFTEMAKQAHKFVIAYTIAKYEEDRSGTHIDWISLIEGGIFEFLHRVVVTDIKPPVFHKLMNHEEQRKKLNQWVLEKHLMEDFNLLPEDITDRFSRYFSEREETIEKKILKASHYLATKWEFDFIYDWSRNLYGIERTKNEINGQIEEHKDLRAVREMLRGMNMSDKDKGIYGFIALVGQLRFQKRWAQTPRIPQTTVLGHLLFVAILSYLISMELHGCPRRKYNNFFGGLFHDLPEVLTRDIISPVKKSVEGLDELIKSYERSSMEESIFPLVPDSWHQELRYFTESEFEDKIRRNSKDSFEIVSDTSMQNSYNSDVWDPMDGKVIEACDKLAAFIEASQSISFGIHSKGLEDGMTGIYSRYNKQQISGYPMGLLFDYFK